RVTTAAGDGKVVRSKNAGPYELTLDIIFIERFWFDEAVRCDLINRSVIAGLYGVEESDVLSIVAFAPANAIKATLRRPLASGAVGETDVYGAQQHAPLLTLTFGNE
ncbi:MAG: DUF4387 domain-containing protein, partial [Candidatus Puniceispirillaceae bacterium]